MNIIKYISPEAPMPAAAHAAARREVNVSGVRLGILDNAKSNADHLLAFLVEALRAEMPVVSVIRHRKPGASVPATDVMLDDFTRDADCVLSAMAD